MHRNDPPRPPRRTREIPRWLWLVAALAVLLLVIGFLRQGFVGPAQSRDGRPVAEVAGSRPTPVVRQTGYL